MGSRVSRSTAAAGSTFAQGIPTAMVVVASDGSMAQLAAPATARDALGGGRRRGPCFVCCSDELYLDAPVRALAAHEDLQAGQLYFVLPLSMLGRPLSGREMAALAVKASAALGAAAGVAPKGKNGGGPSVKQDRRRRRKGRVQPVADAEGEPAGGYDDTHDETVPGDHTVGKTRNGAGHRSSAARRRKAVQRLSTIAEGNE